MSLPREKIVELSKMGLDDLYEIVGRDLVFKGSDPAVFDYQPSEDIVGYLFDLQSHPFRRRRLEKVLTRQEFIKSGRRYLARRRDGFRQKICIDWNFCKKRGNYSDNITLMSAVVGIVGSFLPGFPAVSVYAVCAILTKKGLDKLCRCPPKGRKSIPKVGRKQATS